jgi:hypothetical protein
MIILNSSQEGAETSIRVNGYKSHRPAPSLLLSNTAALLWSLPKVRSATPMALPLLFSKTDTPSPDARWVCPPAKIVARRADMKAFRLRDGYTLHQ